jgi:hypothetical protein
VVLEGIHDIHFLRRLSQVLHPACPGLPDLVAWEQAGRLVFVPTGGGDPLAWAERLRGLDLPEFHLWDRETPPETERRRRAAAIVNGRLRCQAVVTAKRALENYLHAAAIQEARELTLAVDDDGDLPEAAARESLRLRHPHVDWASLTRRTHKRLRDRAKHGLNTLAVERMTCQRLAERDPAGELTGWLRAIGRLAGASRRSFRGRPDSEEDP